MLTLHYAPGTISVASAIALNEAGVTHDLVRVDFASAEQTKPAYLAINPKGRVPALETPHGILTETIAVLEFAAPGLVPADPWDAAKMREIMTYIASTAHVNHAHKMRGYRWADAETSHADMKAKIPQTMTDAADYLESKVAGPFALGDTLTLADAYLYPVVSWLPADGVLLDGYPKLAAFKATMEARPSVVKARADGVIPA
ncbi:MAG: glutathione S-transferase family protein [Pseudomonadota bacterium]